MIDFQQSQTHGLYHLLNRVTKMPLNGCIDYNLSLALGEKKTKTFKVSNSGTVVKLYIG